MNFSRTTLAFVKREILASLASRVAWIVPAGGLAAGLATRFSGDPADLPIAAPLFLLQVLLYGIPLAAILAATGSAHADSAESPLLSALPASPLARATGKFVGLLCSFTIATMFAIAIPLASSMPLNSATLLFGYGLGVAALFLAFGLLVGFAIHDGIKAHLAALGLWFALTLGASLVGYLLLPAAGAAQQPLAWAGLMMLSPLDALRVGVLFSVESIPFDTASLPALTRWWLHHPGLWFGLLTLALTTATLLLTSRACRR